MMREAAMALRSRWARRAPAPARGAASLVRSSWADIRIVDSGLFSSWATPDRSVAERLQLVGLDELVLRLLQLAQPRLQLGIGGGPSRAPAPSGARCCRGRGLFVAQAARVR